MPDALLGPECVKKKPLNSTAVCVFHTADHGPLGGCQVNLVDHKQHLKK